MTRIGIVGHEAAKFLPATEQAARALIRQLLADPTAVLVSGRCHLGGIDVWAEEEADRLGRSKVIYPPRVRNWSNGYKPRNEHIATTADVVNVLVVRQLPPSYSGLTFPYCYHCQSRTHVKSGACWTAHYAMKHGKPAVWYVLEQFEHPPSKPN